MAGLADQEFLRSIFLMEAWDTVASIEEAVGRLAAEDDATGAYGALGVVTHRLKGAASLHGCAAVADLADAMERVLAGLPNAPAADHRAGVERLGELVGLLKTALEELEQGGAGPPPAAEPAPPRDPLRAELERFFADRADVLSYFGPEANEHIEGMTSALLALERGGSRDEELGRLFRAVHTLKGAAYVVGCAPVGSVAHRIEDLLVGVRENRVPLSPAAIESVWAGIDVVRLMLGPTLAPGANLTTALEDAVGRLTALLGETEPAPAPAPAPPPAPVSAWAPAPTTAEAVAEPDRNDVEPTTPTAVRPPPAARPDTRRAGPARSSRQTIRVSLDRLDALMDLVGELVIARSRLERRLAELDRVNGTLGGSRSRMTRTIADFERRHLDPHPLVGGPVAGATPEPADGAERTGESRSVAELFADLEFDRYDDFNIFARSIAEISSDIAELQAELGGLIRVVRQDLAQVHRLGAALRTEIGQTRLVPIGGLFTRFARQGQEAARAAGKTVRIETHGETVELDTGIIEQIVDPLLHLVQNAVTHGIESAEERRAAGKPAAGTVTLSAFHQGGSVYVEVADDGRGIDAEVVRRQAVAQGLVPADVAAALSEREALGLVFLPGLTTAATVTTASGRGVGLDVVRSNVARLNGEVDVDTQPGGSTRFTLKLPLTLLVSEALFVRAGGRTLAVPFNAVQVITTLGADEIDRTPRGERVVIRDQSLSLVSLARVLALAPPAREARIEALVLRAGGQAVAVEIDGVLHKEEIVIKSLGAFLEGVGPFAGGSVSAAGEVTLLLDPVRVVEAAIGAREAPRTAASPAPVGPGLPAAAVGGRPMGGGTRRVLLVDDSISVRKFVGQMLERARFTVTTASDGAEALARLADGTFEVVITDLEMPRINGYELIEDLRRRPATRHLPVVVLTTRSGEKHVNLARRLGVDHYVTKPVDEQAFVGLIESLVVGVASASGARAAAR